MGMNVLVMDMVLGQVLVVGGRRKGCCAACNPGSGSSGRGLGLNNNLVYHNIYRIQHQPPLHIPIYTEYSTNNLVYQIYTEYSTNNLVYHNIYRIQHQQPCISQYIQNKATTTLAYHNIYRIEHQQPLHTTIYTE